MDKRISLAWLAQCAVLFSALMVMLLLAACTKPGEAFDEVEARQMASRFYEAALAGDLASAVGGFAADEQDRWQHYLGQVQAKLGRMQSYKPKIMDVNTVYMGRFYIIDMSVMYEKESVIETLTLLRRVDDDQLLIVAYKVNASGL